MQKKQTMNEQPKGSVEHAVSQPVRKAGYRLLAFWALLIGLFLAIWQILAPARTETPLAFTDFMYLVRADPAREPYVEEVSLRGRQITSWVRNQEKKTRTAYITTGPEKMDGLVAELEAQHVAIGYEIDVQQTLNSWAFGSGITGALAGTVALIIAGRVLAQLRQNNDRLARLEEQLGKLSANEAHDSTASQGAKRALALPSDDESMRASAP
jgi:hypothetical protein